MIIIKIQGGLGNQLLQYSFGKVIEYTFKKKVSYDLSFYQNKNTYTDRVFLLDKFNIVYRVATKEEIALVRYPYGFFSKVDLLFKKIVNKFFLKKYQVTYDEKFFSSLKKKDNLYLEGFWQSYRYCLPIIETLRKEFTLRENFSDVAKIFIDEVKQKNSIAVHIRRGDYLLGGKNLQVLDKEYYKKSVDFLNKNTEKPIYYIFSDDIVWVKEYFSDIFENVVYVSCSSVKDYEELLLMSLCNHIIVANSTFSWWAAILHNKKDSFIICPKDWKNIFVKDLTYVCLDSWKRF